MTAAIDHADAAASRSFKGAHACGQFIHPGRLSQCARGRVAPFLASGSIHPAAIARSDSLHEGSGEGGEMCHLYEATSPGRLGRRVRSRCWRRTTTRQRGRRCIGSSSEAARGQQAQASNHLAVTLHASSRATNIRREGAPRGDQSTRKEGGGGVGGRSSGGGGGGEVKREMEISERVRYEGMGRGGGGGGSGAGGGGETGAETTRWAAAPLDGDHDACPPSRAPCDKAGIVHRRYQQARDPTTSS